MYLRQEIAKSHARLSGNADLSPHDPETARLPLEEARCWHVP